MKLIRFPFALILVLPLILLSSCTEQKERPNIIFLLTDDQRWDALGAMGNGIIQTPNLDMMANEGILFSNAYVTTSICCCSRASILTGQFVSRHGINSFRQDLIGEGLQNTYPLLLKNLAGYKTGFIGKYGVGREQRPADHYDFWTCENVGQPKYEGEDDQGNYLHYTDKVSGDIQAFLDIYADQGPFCLSVSFKAPHVQDNDPRQFIYHPRYKDLYADVRIPLPGTAAREYWDFFPDDFQANNEARKRWGIRFPDPEKYQESVRSYYRLITGVDDVTGKLIDRLEELGIADNTIIILMGDNGFYLAEHGMAGKWFAHEESIRVPFFIYDPRLPSAQRGQKIDKMTLNIDVAPTILSLAGLEVPGGMQGSDLTPLYSGESGTIPWRTEFFYEHTIDIPTIPKSLAVIGEQFKYIRYPELESGFEEFYDRINDPGEKRNLVNEPTYGRLVEEYKAKLDHMKEQAK